MSQPDILPGSEARQPTGDVELQRCFNEIADWNHSAEDRQNFEGPKSANYDGIEIPIERHLAYHH